MEKQRELGTVYAPVRSSGRSGPENDGLSWKSVRARHINQEKPWTTTID